jgi:hypothetical protein
MDDSPSMENILQSIRFENPVLFPILSRNGTANMPVWQYPHDWDIFLPVFRVGNGFDAPLIE